MHFLRFKQKDLIDLPHLVAMALVADGWYLRSAIPWLKLAPQPESADDRPTVAHEYVFLLTKGERYYYDAEGVRKGASAGTAARLRQATFHTQRGGDKDYAEGTNPNRSCRNALENLKASGGSTRHFRTTDFARAVAKAEFDFWGDVYSALTLGGAVVDDDELLAIITAGAGLQMEHYASFPVELAETCIKAGTSEAGACGACGAQRERVVERKAATPGQAPGYLAGTGTRNDGGRAGSWVDHSCVTLDFRPTCTCNAPSVPAVVMDPFLGSGTIALACERLGRDWVGCEISEHYAEMARKRLVARGDVAGYVKGKRMEKSGQVAMIP